MEVNKEINLKTFPLVSHLLQETKGRKFEKTKVYTIDVQCPTDGGRGSFNKEKSLLAFSLPFYSSLYC